MEGYKIQFDIFEYHNMQKSVLIQATAILYKMHVILSLYYSLLRDFMILWWIIMRVLP